MANRKSYYEKLRDPRWQRRRLELFDKYGFACTNCGDTSSELHVHHAVYRRGADPWDYDDHELRVLCAACHGLEEAAKKCAIQKLGEADAWQSLHALIVFAQKNDETRECEVSSLLLSVAQAVESIGSTVLVSDLLGQISQLSGDEAEELLIAVSDITLKRRLQAGGVR